MWTMGKHSIDRGNRDHWSDHAEGRRDGGAIDPRLRPAPTAPTAGEAAGGMGGGRPAGDFAKFFHDPAKRDLRGYILPADQPDFLTATKFVNTLDRHRHRRCTARRPTFAVGDKKYPAGSYVVKCGPGVPRPRLRHVRAAGPPGRLRGRPDARRRRRTTWPAGRWPSRWA